MKMSELRKMSIGDILLNLKFTRPFIADFDDWCKKQPQEEMPETSFGTFFPLPTTYESDKQADPSLWIRFKRLF